MTTTAATNGGGAGSVRLAPAVRAEPPPAPPSAGGDDGRGLPRRQRRLGLAALGVLLAAGGAAVAGSAALGGQSAVDVLVAARAVPAGTVVQAEDLRAASLSGSGVSLLSAAAASQVVGQTATVDLVEGTVLTDAMVDEAPSPRPGFVVVGVAAGEGQAPVGELVAGVRVAVVEVAQSGQGGRLLSEGARLLGESLDERTGASVLSVEVPRDAAVRAAAAAARGELAVVVLSPVDDGRDLPGAGSAPVGDPAAGDSGRQDDTAAEDSLGADGDGPDDGVAVLGPDDGGSAG